MSRKSLIRTNTFPYHVTLRCNSREAFHLELQAVWEIIPHELWVANRTHGLMTHAFALMPNHIHLLVSSANGDLGVAMRDFIRETTQRINIQSKRTGRVFGGKYHWSLIGDERYFFTALKYVYRNPVKAKLSETTEDYQYSSLNRLLGLGTLSFSIEPSIFGGTDALWTINDGFLDWINRDFPEGKSNLIKSALQKTEFTHLIDRLKREQIDLGSDITQG